MANDGHAPNAPLQMIGNVNFALTAMWKDAVGKSPHTDLHRSFFPSVGRKRGPTPLDNLPKCEPSHQLFYELELTTS